MDRTALPRKRYSKYNAMNDTEKGNLEQCFLFRSVFKEKAATPPYTRRKGAPVGLGGVEMGTLADI